MSIFEIITDFLIFAALAISFYHFLKTNDFKTSLIIICGYLGGAIGFFTLLINILYIFSTCHDIYIRDVINWYIACPIFVILYIVSILLLYIYYTKKPKEIDKERVILLMLMKKMCQFNLDAKNEQYKLVDDFFHLTEYDNWENLDPFFFSWMNTIPIIKELSLHKKQIYMNLLFKLAITRDGIKLDEWSFLMDVMTKINLNNNWKQHLIKRYSPLRTEFEEQEEEYIPKSKPTADTSMYFNILGIESTSDIAQIRKAYHALALIHHPDMHQNANRKNECEAKMAQINDAYEKIIASL